MATFQELLDKIKQNQDDSNDMIKQQVALAGKRFQDPDYEPSPEEASNEDKYYDSVNGAVAGSLGGGEAPKFGGLKGLVAKEAEAAAPKTIMQAAGGPTAESLVQKAAPSRFPSESQVETAKKALDAASDVSPYSNETGMAAQKFNRLTSQQSSATQQAKQMQASKFARAAALDAQRAALTPAPKLLPPQAAEPGTWEKLMALLGRK